MDRIITSFASDPSIQQPFTTGSLDFLQNNVLGQVNMICRSMIRQAGYTYSASVPYQMFNAGGAGRYIFFNGELYFMQPPAGGNNIVNLIIINGTADPLTFTDNVARNVHNQRTLDPQTGTLGTGLFDLVDIVNISDAVITSPSLLNSFTVSASLTPGYNQISNIVHLQGAATRTTGSTASIMTVPAPSVTRNIPCVTYNGTNYIANILSISTSGDVGLLITSGTNIVVFFDGLSYAL